MEKHSTKNSRGQALAFWMKEVLRQHRRALKRPSAKTVHQLRVAIRRCRSLANGARELDPRGPWKGLNRAAKGIFRPLGKLRDAQVQAQWIRKLRKPDDPIANAALTYFKHLEEIASLEAHSALREFGRSQWADWREAARGRIERAGRSTALFQALAARQLAVFLQSQRTALRGQEPTLYHELRIELKRFRYLVENFLPQWSGRWRKELKTAQDLLGEAHDLWVLARTLESQGLLANTPGGRRWRRVLEQARAERIWAYREMMGSPKAPWYLWQKKLKSISKGSVGPSAEGARGSSRLPPSRQRARSRPHRLS